MYKTYGFNLRDIYKSNFDLSEEMNAILQQREFDEQKHQEELDEKENNKDKNTDKEEKIKRKKFLGVF